MKELRDLLNVPEDHVECRACYGGGASVAAVRHLGGGVVNPERGAPCARCEGVGFHAPDQPKPMTVTERHVAISLALRDAHSTAVLAKLNGHFLAGSLLEVARNALLAHGKSAEEIARSEESIEAGWRAGKRREWTPEGEPISEREVEALR